MNLKLCYVAQSKKIIFPICTREYEKHMYKVCMSPNRLRWLNIKTYHFVAASKSLLHRLLAFQFPALHLIGVHVVAHLLLLVLLIGLVGRRSVVTLRVLHGAATIVGIDTHQFPVLFGNLRPIGNVLDPGRIDSGETDLRAEGRQMPHDGQSGGICEAWWWWSQTQMQRTRRETQGNARSGGPRGENMGRERFGSIEWSFQRTCKGSRNDVTDFQVLESWQLSVWSEAVNFPLFESDPIVIGDVIRGLFNTQN